MAWNMRLRLLNFIALQLKRKEYQGLSSINHYNQLSEAYHFGKHSGIGFLKEDNSRETNPLQLVHNDVHGLINPAAFDI